MRYLNERAKRRPLGIKPNYNLAPTQLAPVVLVRDNERELSLFRWGLVPSWAKDVKDASKYSLINARGEEIETKRSYANPFRKRRCIAPISGFIEWKREGDSKRPFAISLRNEAIMSIAGVWEEWVSKSTGEIIDSFALITTSANSFMTKIHDRMPVILERKDEEAWLDPKNEDPRRLAKFLRPCPDEWLKAYEISALINSPKNNRPEVLEPVGGAERLV